MSESPTPLAPGWRSYTDWDDYRSTWSRLNRGFLQQAIQRLPKIREVTPVVHVPGIGPGRELIELKPFYPDARYITSDITTAILPSLSDVHGLINMTRRFILEDVNHPAVQNVDLCVNLFLLHLVENPPHALASLWSTLKPGGWLATVYFPPVPSGEGPLAALFWAVNEVLGGRSKPNWEQVVMPWLMSHASRLTSRALYAQWTFDHPEDFQAAMELLPHIRALRNKLGEERYAEVWNRWNDQTGLLMDHSETWHGTVAARFLLAQKPPVGRRV